MNARPIWTCACMLPTLLGCSGKPTVIADLYDAAEPSAAIDADDGSADARDEDTVLAHDGGSASSEPAASPRPKPQPQPGSREAYCAGQGPVVSVPNAGQRVDRCTGQIASQLFRYALCTCDTVNLQGALVTAAFDSRQGPLSPSGANETGAAVGVNGSLNSVGSFNIGGSLTVGSGAGTSLTGPLTVRGDLRLRGPFNYYGEQIVGRDAWLQAAMNGAGDLTVSGDLHQKAGAGRNVLGAVTVQGRDLRDSVEVAPPCACEENQLLDVAAVVADGAEHNHNLEAGFDRDALSNVLGPRTLELPCGKLFLSRIAGLSDVTLQVNGRTALIVGADVGLAGSLNIELGPQGALDLFVGGVFNFAGTQNFGDPSRTARIRMYVASSSGLNIIGSTDFVGNLYAPRSVVNVGGDMKVYGSIFAKKINKVGDTFVYYDSAVVSQGDSCDPPPAGCDSCDDCGATKACVAGACGACRSDTDCCQPLTCNAGKCGVLELL